MASRKLLTGMIAAALAALVFAPGAVASKAITPTAKDFGERAIGSPSAPFPFTLSATCIPQDAVPCMFMENIIIAISVTGDFEVVSETCPATLIGDIADPGFTETCTIMVRFTPLASGPRTGTLSTGGPGDPTAALSGSGPRIPPAPVVVTTTPPPAGKKKCKKGRKLRKGKCVKKKRKKS